MIPSFSEPNRIGENVTDFPFVTLQICWPDNYFWNGPVGSATF